MRIRRSSRTRAFTIRSCIRVRRSRGSTSPVGFSSLRSTSRGRDTWGDLGACDGERSPIPQTQPAEANRNSYPLPRRLMTRRGTRTVVSESDQNDPRALKRVSHRGEGGLSRGFGLGEATHRRGALLARLPHLFQLADQRRDPVEDAVHLMLLHRLSRLLADPRGEPPEGVAALGGIEGGEGGP